ncbi:MAG: hypothetical protein M1821_001675 [Bathelium mastoideum]|nr:MAG: hypothetical protein M1821_001675 [Bathelium mastoideum]
MSVTTRGGSSPGRDSLPPRPPIVSHQSNSVPSTPHQHARGRMANSRSPSPVGRLGSHSPQSVTSEANRIMSAYPKSDSGGGCKYEGSLVPRRRFIYTEGGDSILEPPKKQPKVALEAHEEDKLSGDMRELHDRLLPDEDSTQRRLQLLVKLEKLLNQKWPGKDIRVHVFVDICITTSMKELEKVCMLAEVLAQNGMQKVVCVSSAKVPIVKIWDPELKLACDLNVNNTAALENTRMIKTYVEIDERVRPLAMIIKHWTSRRIINDAAMGATISSYTWLCMIINFLQTRRPPVLPVLHQAPHLMRHNDKGIKSTFADDVPSLRGYGQANRESLGQLLFQFFRRYGYEIDYEKFVISVRQGKLVTRDVKGWPLERRLCVEEPFNTYRNLGNSADDYSFHGIHEELRRAFDLLADGLKLDQCLEQYVFPPLEKATFKRPEPKPKPILSRSHSQTRRNSNINGLGGLNLNLKGKQQFNQRNGPSGRRSSSGAAFGQPRHGYAHSPPIGANSNDYFDSNNLHNQLLQQYQYLNIRENMLKAQMAHTQVHPVQGHLPGNRVVATPNPRSVTSNPSNSHRGTASELPQQDALLPGFLYHFPVNYPRAQMPPQASQHDNSGASTNPSSPSLMATVPAINRVHRASANDSSGVASVRSQSQPGRSTPNPLAVHAYAHPGFDVSGAIGHPMARPLPGFVPQGQNGAPGRYAQIPPFSGTAVDPGMAKEYVGYYVGESPQLMPQYHVAGLNAAPPYTDVPTRRRHVSPEFPPPEGLIRPSRSPSPLSRPRAYSNGLHSAPLPEYVPPHHAPIDVPEPNPDEPPPIVNGSFPVTPLVNSNHHGFDPQDSVPSTSSIRTSGNLPKLPEFGDFGQSPDELSRRFMTSDLNDACLEERYNMDSQSPNSSITHDKRTIPNGDLGGNAELSSAQGKQSFYGQNGINLPETPQEKSSGLSKPSNSQQAREVDDGRTSRTALDRAAESRPAPVPQLSPVFETQSPSPIMRRRLEAGAAQGNAIVKSSVNGPSKENQNLQAENPSRTHERSRSQPNPAGANSSTAPAPKPLALANGHANGWQQQKSRKGGRRGGNFDEERGRFATGGEPLPANEAQRKGG